jgi:hypothetical protein
MQNGWKRLSAPALNYGILLSTPLKNFKEEKTVSGEKQIGCRLPVMPPKSIYLIVARSERLVNGRRGRVKWSRRKLDG